MRVKLTTVGVVAAAALILIPYGTQDAPEARVEPVAAPATKAAATKAAATAAVHVSDVIAAQGNAALAQIRAEATRPTPPDLSKITVDGGPQ